MHGSKCYFIAAVFLLNVLSAGATQRCNAANFALKGVVPCALNWWSTTDLSTEVTFSPNLTSLVSSSLEKFNLSVSVVNDALGQMLNGSGTLSKLVESGVIVEPYVVYLVADAIRGFNLTNEELGKLGLSRHLSNESVLQSLYLNYFSLSCRNLLHPLTTCIESWVQTNCNSNSDDAEYVLEAIDEMTNYYCHGNKTKLSVKNLLNESFGSVLAPVARYFGVYKDRDSPFIFNLSASSVFFSQEKMEQLGSGFMRNCSYLLTEFSVFESTFSGDSTVGIGKVAKRMLGFVQKMAECSMATWNSFDPSFFRNHRLFMDHMQFLAASVGVDELRWLPSSFSKKRQTAAAFGGNHILTFSEVEPVTCPTGSFLLNNKFFTVIPTNTRLSGGSYISQVVITFSRGLNSSAYYQTGKGPISTRIYGQVATLQLEPLPKGVVRITDRVSGAVFVLTKFEESYLVIVRAGEEIHETSIGTLAEECLPPINIWTSIPQAPTQLKKECDKGCAKVPQNLRNNCVYDCIGTRDVKVANYYTRLPKLRALAAAKDPFIASILN